jgi:hypothetical protein
VWYNKDVPREGDAEMPHGYQQAPEKKSSEMEKPSEKPLTLDHESDIMNIQQRKENLPNQKGLTP